MRCACGRTAIYSDQILLDSTLGGLGVLHTCPSCHADYVDEGTVVRSDDVDLAAFGVRETSASRFSERE